MSARGMTLLELLAALALLSTFVIAAHAWTISVVRWQGLVRGGALLQMDRVLGAITQDLIASSEVSVENGSPVLLTSRVLPGDPLTDTGWQRVTWQIDRDELVRVNGQGDKRVIMRGITSFAVELSTRAETGPDLIRFTIQQDEVAFPCVLHWEVSQ